MKHSLYLNGGWKAGNDDFGTAHGVGRTTRQSRLVRNCKVTRLPLGSVPHRQRERIAGQMTGHEDADVAQSKEGDAHHSRDRAALCAERAVLCA
jgi:hypothetical protein